MFKNPILINKSTVYINYIVTPVDVNPTGVNPTDDYMLIGYGKINKSYIITFGIRDVKDTDIDRDGVVDDRYALFNARCVDIIKIENMYDLTDTPDTINDSQYVYTVNTNICCMRPESCIVFYKTREAVISHEVDYARDMGVDTGKYRIYYSDTGVLHSEYNYVDGKLNGISKHYYPNGVIMLEEIFMDGLRDGVCKHYNKNGDKTCEDYFEYGEKVGKSKLW